MHSPADSTDDALLRYVAPSDWVNPQPAERYQLVVIGAGSAGLVTAIGAQGLGAKVAIVERHRLGGDCLNYGCVPSKALLHSAQVAATARRAAEFGVQVGQVSVDFPAVMARIRTLRNEIAPHDSVQRLRDLGIDVFLGEAKFTGPDQLCVSPRSVKAERAGTGNQIDLRFSRAVIATGTRPSIPSIPGLVEAGFVTNETVFSLTELPARLAILGGGPIGCELAQAFARLGSTVTLIQSSAQLLPHDDPEAASIVQRALEHEGVTVRTRCNVARVTLDNVAKTLVFDGEQGRGHVVADVILVAAGRVPNLEALGLEAAGVRSDPVCGVEVDDSLFTSNSRILAAGDICSRHRFTHTADAYARIAVQNALLPVKGKVSRLVVPWCTYTDPEVAHVGLTEVELVAKNIAIETYTHPFSRVDRGVLSGETSGFAKVHVKRGTDRILGATIVGPHAGELISELAVLMTAKLGLGQLAKTIHPYPTLAEANRKVADAWNRTRLTPFVQRLLQTWIRWRL